MNAPRQLHPLTVLFRGARSGLSTASFVYFIGSTVAGPASAYLGLAGNPLGLLVVPLAVLVLVVAFAYESARYRRFEYELTADTLDIRSGVFARRDREIPLRRVQNVDISRSVIGRALGMATVDIETAGGGETEANLQYVGFAEAERLQETIRTRKARQESEGDGEDDHRESREPADAATDETELLFELDTDDLLLASALTADLRVVPVLLFLGPVLAPAVTWITDLGTGASLLVVAGAVGALGLLALAAWGLSALSTFIGLYDFRLSRVGDDLRYERGLLQRYDGSIPLDKIQTVTVEENVLMRQFGYAALSVETAGYAPGSAPSGGSEAAIPLAKRARVFDLAADIEGIDEPTVERPPERARQRYAVRYALAAGVLALAGLAVDTLVTPVPWPLAVALLAAAPFAARCKWRHRGRGLGATHVVTRNGFWKRTTKFVPYYRVQTVIDRRTVFQRRWRLASVIVDTAGTRSLTGQDAVAADIDEDDASRFRIEVADRLETALSRRQARTERDRASVDDAD